MIDTVKNRRTIRKYLQKDISSDLLNDLLETSSRASTMGGMQLYSVVITRNAEMKEKLSPAHFNQPMVKGAPVVLTFCADFRRFSKWCEQRNAVPGYDNLMSFMRRKLVWEFVIWGLPLTILKWLLMLCNFLNLFFLSLR